MRQCVTREPREAVRSHDELIEALTSRIEKMAAYFGRQRGVDENDLRQEAWVAALEMLPRLDHGVGSAEQLLLKRVRWRILDTIRFQRRRIHLELDEIQRQATYLDSRHDIDISLLNARLTTPQRRILRGLMEGCTWREVGALIGCTSANVAYHVRRIREAYLAIESEK